MEEESGTAAKPNKDKEKLRAPGHNGCVLKNDRLNILHAKHKVCREAGFARLLTKVERQRLHDTLVVTRLVPLIEAIVPIGGVRGRPLSRLGCVYADRGYDHDKYRRILHAHCPHGIARRGHRHGSGLGNVRWVFVNGGNDAAKHAYVRDSLRPSR